MTTVSSTWRRLAAAGLLFFTLAWSAAAQAIDVAQRLDGFDAYMAKTLEDWNAPGVGVGVVVNDKLVFAKGYGFRDYEKKLPFTPGTMSPIASNTKLFTAVAAGMLVEEGKLTWDKPVRESVPAVRFFNDQLNNTVTLRDMLSHRTGITRHDTIWYKSDFTRKQLFEKLVYLEPQEPVRETFLYNNLMFASERRNSNSCRRAASGRSKVPCPTGLGLASAPMMRSETVSAPTAIKGFCHSAGS